MGSALGPWGTLGGAALGAGAGFLAGGALAGGSRNSKGKVSLPAMPLPANEYSYQDGNLKAQRVWNPAMNGYQDQTFLTPNEQAIQNQSESGMASTLQNATSALGGLTPDVIEQYKQNWLKPQVDALTKSYNDASGAATNAAAASGTQGSVGFDHYLVNEIERNKAQGLADLNANAETQKYGLASQVLQPYQDAYNFYSGAQGGIQNNQNNSLTPAFQGSQAQNNFGLSNFQNGLNLFQTGYPLQRGFVNRLFGT